MHRTRPLTIQTMSLLGKKLLIVHRLNQASFCTFLHFHFLLVLVFPLSVLLFPLLLSIFTFERGCTSMEG